MVADSIPQLVGQRLTTILSSSDPRFVQVKDPFLYDHAGTTHLMFCTHPFCWTSSNSGYVTLNSNSKLVGDPNFEFFPRGFTWDVAMTRATAVLPVPNVGPFSNRDVSLLFYDGGECVRDLDQHTAAVKRPRGYSCEELGGLAYMIDGDLGQIHRLSLTGAMFVSPYGTGCSRYVDVLATADGYYATWQQSQPDGSQPLVMNFVGRDQVDRLLTK
jgi:hypothetical protein